VNVLLGREFPAAAQPDPGTVAVEMWRVLAAAAVLAAALTGCNDTDESGDASVTTTSASVTTVTIAVDPPPTTQGCGAAAEPGVTVVDLVSGGIDRRYRLYVPPGYTAAQPMPVVLDFHGLTGTAEQQALLSDLEGLAGTEGFIAVHPQGSVDPATGMTFFELGQASTVDDVAFTADILDDLAASLCVDPARVYAMGFSNGGYMSSRLACDLADRIAAITTVAATTHPDDCAPSRAVPVQAFHGTADRVVPFEGGDSALLDTFEQTADSDDPAAAARLQAAVDLLGLAIPDEVGEWAAANGCSGETSSPVGEDVTLTTYQGCTAPVLFYVVEGGGHSWPGSQTSRTVASLGHTTMDVDATRLAWEFFQQHSL
jgi:polyhydroxybutyrate depolymerase